MLAKDLSYPLYYNNQGLIALAKNPKNHQYTKYIDIQYYYIWGKKEDSTIAINYLPIEKMIINRLTKALISAKIKIFIKQLRLCLITEHALREYVKFF